ncbi:MAG TPA: hypothetical protein VFT84_00330, partial [Gemmatimonadales bacterium]|nr:hypothetical protein [Gemmatimonadales bacterium]
MCGPLEPLKRVNYYEGKLLTADDFRDEQEYHRERSRLHNRCCHGWGIACGLDVSIDGNELAVSPGLALDC